MSFINYIKKVLSAFEVYEVFNIYLHLISLPFLFSENLPYGQDAVRGSEVTEVPPNKVVVSSKPEMKDV